MQTNARLPAYDIPMADSMAVFSLADHNDLIFFSLACFDPWIYSAISVEGVPGYA